MPTIFNLTLLVILLVGFPRASHAVHSHSSRQDISGGGSDHNWHRLEEKTDPTAKSRGDIKLEVGLRARDGPTALGGNDVPSELSISPGNTQQLVYPNNLRQQSPNPQGSGLPWDGSHTMKSSKARDDLKKRDIIMERQGDTMIYISINTCQQPVWNGSATQATAPPQLTLYVASQVSNKEPGPQSANGTQVILPLSEGFANFSIAATDDWHMAVSAPTLPHGFSGAWSYELAVSRTDFYHSVETSPNQLLFLVDTDDNSALLVTDNLTETGADSENYKKWMDLRTPFIMFASKQDQTKYMGVQNSYCGWSWAKQIAADQADPDGSKTRIQMGMVTRGLGNRPKEQFYVTELSSSTSYVGALAMPGNSTKAGSGIVGGGGTVWPPVFWTTKADGNCALLFNLTFCSEVAYAVPSNPSKYDIDGMRKLFDNYTSTSYQAFNYSLQQVPCNTSSDARYSLAKNCDDCAAAYKEWLCAVSIPRCEDFTNPAIHLQPRNVGQKFVNGSSLSLDFLGQQYLPMSKAPTSEGSPRDQGTYLDSLATNSSRNPLIDEQIMPGPYKEVLPCEDLCYSLMQSCASSLGFACPLPGRGLEVSYGRRSSDGSLTCSYLGAVYDINAGHARSVPTVLVVTVALLIAVGVM